MPTNEADEARQIHGVLTAYLKSQAVFSALSLGVFDHLEGEERTARDLAVQLGLHERPTRALLLALEGLGLLARHGSQFTNAPAASRYLVTSSSAYMGSFAEHQAAHFANFLQLPSSIRTNTSVTKRVLKEGYSDQGAGVGEGDVGRERLIGAMRVSSRLQADELAQKLCLPARTTLVDLGCGSGDYSIAIARQHPEVRVIAVDYPAVSAIASRNVAEAGLSARIDVRSANIMTDPLPMADAILLSHVLDGYGREQTRHLVTKIFQELRPEGHLHIHSHMPDVSEGVFPALFGVILLINTEEGEVYEASELEELLRGVGFGSVTREEVSFLSGLISAIRPRR